MNLFLEEKERKTWEWEWESRDDTDSYFEKFVETPCTCFVHATAPTKRSTDTIRLYLQFSCLAGLLWSRGILSWRRQGRQTPTVAVANRNLKGGARVRAI